MIEIENPQASVVILPLITAGRYIATLMPVGGIVWLFEYIRERLK